MEMRGIETGGGAVVSQGVYTEGGDFIGRDQINYSFIHVYQAVSDDAARRYGQFVESSTQEPYRPDKAFSSEDRELFDGREVEMSQIVRRLRQQRSLALYGPADVGKTSLIAAGVIPQLTEIGALVIHLRDYAHAIGYLRDALHHLGTQMELDLDAEMSFPRMVELVVANASQGLFLVLDQFERFFMPDVSTRTRERLTQGLIRLFEETRPAYFRLLVSIREDMQPALDQLWGDLLPDLRESPVYLHPLRRKDAKKAIETPLRERLFAASFSDDLVDRRLLPDLDSLTGEQDDRIQPAELQIVCQALYESAQDRGQHHIDAALYLEITGRKGAERIVSAHFERLLARLPVEERALARQLMSLMLDPSLDFWIAPDQLHVDGVAPPEIEKALAAMSDAGLLVWHFAENRRFYAFASNSIAQAALRAGGVDAQRRIRTRNELDYVWRAWVTADTLASRSQLIFLEEYGAIKGFSPVQALLLLRSAVQEGMPVEPWLAQLDTEFARSLLQWLETEAVRSGETPVQLTEQDQARLLLGIDGQLPERPVGETFGEIAWTAVAHPDPVNRETACLSLSVLYGLETVGRLEQAIDVAEAGRWRKAELRGMLADADPQFEDANRSGSRRERFGVWWWRFRRRFSRDFAYIGLVTLGGALGAGLGLGLLRQLLALILAPEDFGIPFYSHFPVGFLLGAGVSLGLLLLRPLRLRPPEHGPEAAAKRSPGPAVLLGTAGFVLVHLLLMTLLIPDTLVAEPLLALMAIPAGFGLSLAVYDQPLAGWHLGPAGWLKRLAAAGFLFGLVQAVFVAAGKGQLALIGGVQGLDYDIPLGDRLLEWGMAAVIGVDKWFHYAAIVDAVLFGIVMALGLTAGMIIAAERFKVWQSLVNRPAG